MNQFVRPMEEIESNFFNPKEHEAEIENETRVVDGLKEGSLSFKKEKTQANYLDTLLDNKGINAEKQPEKTDFFHDDNIDFLGDTLETNQKESFDYSLYSDSEKLLSDTAPYKKRKRRATQHQNSFSTLTKGITSMAKKAGDILNTQEDSQLMDGLPPPVDKRDAFHQPVLPNGQNIEGSKEQ